MNQYLKLFLGVLGVVGIISLSYFGYQSLKDNYNSD